MTGGWAASRPGFEKAFQPLRMSPAGLACRGAGVPVSHSHLALSICTGRTVPRRRPQIPSLLLVCGEKLGNTAEAETLWFWGPISPACPAPAHM